MLHRLLAIDALPAKAETFFTGITGIVSISGITLVDASSFIQHSLQAAVAGFTIYYLIRKNKPKK